MFISTDVDVDIVRLDKGLPLPVYSQAGDAGMDLYSTEDFVLSPHCRRLVGTGIAVAIPEGFAGFIHPRSGLAHKYGLSVVNAPGTIDSGYRGEIKVNLINLDLKAPFICERGDRIAQLVIQPVCHALLFEVDSLDETARGSGGHGSTGVKPIFTDGGPVR